MELTIKDKVYQFKFGMGFLREIDKQSYTTVEGSNVKRNTGLQYAVADLYDENPEGLVNILLIANKTESPRITRDILDDYIDDENTDIEALCKEVLDFLECSNATKKVTTAVLELVEKEKAKQEAQQ